MILTALRKSLLSKASAWAKAQNLILPENSALAAPPPHVAADICLPWPMAIAKSARKNPLEVAQSLAKAFESIPEIETVSASPPGFVNIRLAGSALCANLKAITLSPGSYGRDEAGPGKSVLIEYVSANPTGPLHLASGRAATLGDSLVRILRRIGRKVAAEYYVNDAGGRVELLGQSIKARYEQLRGKDVPVPEKGYQGEYLKDMAAQAPKEAASWDSAAFGRWTMDELLSSHKNDMKAFGVVFDRWFLESELYSAKAVESTLELLKKRGVVYEKDGAVWLGTASEEAAGDDKDRVLVRSDGRPTYFSADIAYHKDKFDRGWETLIDIWGADHHGYVPRMKAAITALGKPPEAFHAIVHQLVHLFRGTEAVKMSKRAGEFVTLQELIKEVGVDACRFFFALRAPNSHMNFDLQLAKKQSSENPVFYCQYVHARIGSIFKEAAKQGILGAGEPLPGPNARFLTSPEERALMVKIAWFPELLKTCERELSPHPLANYILELAGLFHPFYEKCRVVDPANPEVSRARLLLCAGVRDVIREGLGLLGVSAPEQM